MVMTPRINLRLSGYGGQGIILAGVIIAKAAVEYEHIYATQTQSYGAESRGGACMANVVLSQQAIGYPEPEALDILVVMSQSALDRHVGELSPGGTLILDADMVQKIPERLPSFFYRIPATRIAAEELGRPLVANTVMLGAVARLTGIVSVDSLISAMSDVVPSDAVDLNHRAILRGIGLAEEIIS
jgi:2-oxoglutarate ferredoxin oxidoreductase subunit gamma